MKQVNYSYDQYRLVRELVRDQSKTNKEIAQTTGYSVGYVSQLRFSVPREDRKRLRIYLSQYVFDMIDILRSAKDVIEALDGTSVENEKIVDRYRTLMNDIGNRV